MDGSLRLNHTVAFLGTANGAGPGLAGARLR